MKLHNIRNEYKKGSLSKADVQSNPYIQFKLWMNDALRFLEEPTAMVLSTASLNGKPSSRVVLLKDFGEKGFTFYTNYQSRKGQELTINPQASLLFFWKELERQVRIEGRIEKTDKETSDTYFESRPFESRIAGNISKQSEIIESRTELEEAFDRAIVEYNKKPLVRSEEWGGYVLKPDYFEFWQGGKNRLHDRICYVLEARKWKIQRLAP